MTDSNDQQQTELTDEDRLRYETDPKALAWAREAVQRQVDRCREFKAQATERGDAEGARSWHRHANLLEMQLLGSSGCVITAFDERLALNDGALARAHYEVRAGAQR
jgi:hypothetical protein